MTEAIIAIIVFIGGIFFAYRRGKSDTEAKNTAAKAEAGKAAKENRNEVESQDDQYLVDILTGRGKLRK
jgi:cbb3-type cytochrome oxidase subunit 3